MRGADDPRGIVCVQFDPQLGKMEQNAAKARELLSSVQPGSVDLVVLPEMCLTGYLFRSLEAIEPYLEDPYAGQGATFALARDEAQRLQAYVVAGFAERIGDGTRASLQGAKPFDARGPVPEGEDVEEYKPRGIGKAYNAAMVVGPDGKLCKVFRKHFLYKEDTPWADEAPGFEHVDLPRLGRVAVGICMDLNPYMIYSSFEAHELARFCDREQVDMVVLPTAWLMPEEDLAALESVQTPEQNQQPSLPLLNYWVMRNLPLWLPGASESPAGRITYMVACNRTGKEIDTQFGGTSSVLRFVRNKEANLLGAAGSNADALLEVAIPPLERSA